MIDPPSEAIELPVTERHLAFSEARRRYQYLVFAFVARRIRPIEEAEDVTAAVFVDAYRHWHRCKGEPRLWLLGIAHRKVADNLRRKRPTWALREEDALTDAMDEFVTRAEVGEALRILAKLPEIERDALQLQILEELSVEEIGAVLGRSPKAANSLLQRARARVRRIQGDLS